MPATARAQTRSPRKPRRAPARRPAARRRPARRRGASRVRWDKVGRVALTLVLAGVLFSYLSPAINFFNTYRATTAARVEMHSLQAENTKLHHRVQSARDPIVLEREARRQGMVASGERAYVVHGLSG